MSTFLSEKFYFFGENSFANPMLHAVILQAKKSISRKFFLRSAKILAAIAQKCFGGTAEQAN